MEPSLEEVVVDIARVATQLGTRVMLVGAYARDLSLGTTERLSRATNDADFAVLFESWERVDAFFTACEGCFTSIDRRDLKMWHRRSGLKVDIVPCGPIELPPGLLSLRGSTRKLHTVGLSECFALGRPITPELPAVLVPPPVGFVVLKLFAFLDRREHRDLLDLGYVLHALPVDDEAMWDDLELMEAFAQGTLTYEDVRYWQAGRALQHGFSSDTVERIAQALTQMGAERPELRGLLVAGVNGLDPDERVGLADRVLAVLCRAAGLR